MRWYGGGGWVELVEGQGSRGIKTCRREWEDWGGGRLKGGVEVDLRGKIEGGCSQSGCQGEICIPTFQHHGCVLSSDWWAGFTAPCLI